MGVGVGVGAVSLRIGTALIAGDSAAVADIGIGVVILQPGAVSFEFGASAVAEDFETVVADARDLPFVVAPSVSPIADGDFQAPAPNSLLVRSAAGLEHPSLFCSVCKAPALSLSPIPASPCPTGYSLPE